MAGAKRGKSAAAAAATRKLKLYRTAIGFHDAYVAAPSKKAALAAWGSDKDLFARGAAEIVEASPFADELLASPGVVLRKSRGSVAEQLAALPATPPRKAAIAKATSNTRARSPAAKPTPPRPSRAGLDAAERSITTLEAAQAAERRAIDDREAALTRERHALLRAQAGRA